MEIQKNFFDLELKLKLTLQGLLNPFSKFQVEEQLF